MQKHVKRTYPNKSKYRFQLTKAIGTAQLTGGPCVTAQSKLTAAAKALVRACRAEMSEIEACPECYGALRAGRYTWFTDVCSSPHILLWAKLKGK